MSSSHWFIGHCWWPFRLLCCWLTNCNSMISSWEVSGYTLWRYSMSIQECWCLSSTPPEYRNRRLLLFWPSSFSFPYLKTFYCFFSYPRSPLTIFSPILPFCQIRSCFPLLLRQTHFLPETLIHLLTFMLVFQCFSPYRQYWTLFEFQPLLRKAWSRRKE
jgi:hypothetical protein